MRIVTENKVISSIDFYCDIDGETIRIQIIDSPRWGIQVLKFTSYLGNFDQCIEISPEVLPDYGITIESLE